MPPRPRRRPREVRAARAGRRPRCPSPTVATGSWRPFPARQRHDEVTGPLGAPVVAEWKLVPASSGRDGPVAIIEMANASGLLLAGGEDNNDPMEATTAGTGQLILRAVSLGARQVVVGCGGSATTDGGAGALGRDRLRSSLARRGPGRRLRRDDRVPRRGRGVRAPKRRHARTGRRCSTERLARLGDPLPGGVRGGRDPASRRGCRRRPRRRTRRGGSEDHIGLRARGGVRRPRRTARCGRLGDDR